MGKVIQVYLGEDGKVRGVKVKTLSGNYDRPITKLSLLLTKKNMNQRSEEVPSSLGEKCLIFTHHHGIN